MFLHTHGMVDQPIQTKAFFAADEWILKLEVQEPLNLPADFRTGTFARLHKDLSRPLTRIHGSLSPNWTCDTNCSENPSSLESSDSNSMIGYFCQCMATSLSCGKVRGLCHMVKTTRKSFWHVLDDFMVFCEYQACSTVIATVLGSLVNHKYMLRRN